MAPGINPRPDRVPEQDLLTPELGFLVAAELRCVSGENLQCSDVFSSGENIQAKRRREAVDEAARWGPRAAKSGTRLGVSWGLWAPPDLSFWLQGFLAK